jgi:hypothetical protein
MDFMHPGMLAGAGAAAIPVVIHLVMRQRPRKMEFPALRFLQARQTSNRRTLKLRHILLLLLRMGALALLAFALARPSSKLFGMLGDQEGPITAVLVIDTSPRMSYSADGQTRLEAARKIADELLASLPPKSQIGILDSASSSRVFEADLTVARERVAQLKPGSQGQPLAALCESAVELLRDTEFPRKELYVFTDFSVGAWSGNRAGDWGRRAIDRGIAKVQFIDVGAEKPVDYSLGNLSLSEQTLVVHRPLLISTAITSLGAGAKRIVRLSVVDRQTGKLVEKGVETVELGPDETKEVPLPPLSALELGTHQGEVRIDDVDSLPENNVRYFTVTVRTAPRILIAAPEPVATRAAYFSQAIAGRELQVNGTAPYEVTTVPYEKLSEQEFGKFAAVILLDPPALPDPLWQGLEGYVRGGGGVAVFLGGAAKPAAFNGEIPQTVLAGTLTTQLNWPDGKLYFWPNPDVHPLLADFKPVKNSTPWQDFPVLRYWQFTPGEKTTVAATYNNNAEAIVERRIGLGRALTITTPISELSGTSSAERWNFLPIGPQPWPFVVLANGITTYLVGRDDPLNYFSQEGATVRLDPAKRYETYLVTRRNTDAPPLRVAADLKRNVLMVPITDAAGNYRVQAGGTDDGVDLGFSVNLPADGESLRRIDAAEIDRLFADVPHGTVRRFSELKREANPDRGGRELFPILICTVAIVLGLEQVLSNRFYKRG